MMGHRVMEESLLDSIQHAIFKAAQSQFPDIVQSDIEVTRAKSPEFGDYQCNSAMKLAKKYKISPQEWANKVVAEISSQAQGNRALFSKIEIKGPGFINLFLDQPYVIALLGAISSQSDQRLRRVKSSERKKIIIDFSSPNTAKEMHVGHLRSTIIGDCLARIFEARGQEVLRLNHIGDWGTAFGMLIEHIKSTVGEENLSEVESLSLQDLMRLYKESKARFDNEPAFKKEAQKAVVKLQSGDPLHKSLWNIICQTSRKAYQEIYDLLDVRIIERGESFYNPMLADTVREYEEKGLVTVSEGAKCIFLDKYVSRDGTALPLMIQKSDGGYNYDTTDLAAMAHRIRVEGADRIIIVTDSGQSTHFQMVTDAAEKAGVFDRSRVRFDHVPFGLVLGPDGKKFKTRSGETEKLIDLLTAAVTAAKAILKERNPDWSEEERDQVASILGIGSIKYADLSSHRLSDYVFSYERMLRFEGNTAAFIMYSFVRTQGILRRVFSGQEKTTMELKDALSSFEHPSEFQLAKLLLQFDEIVEEVIESLLPNRLTEYLYSLAEQFNIFFRDCRVEGSNQQEARALLVALTRDVLREGLSLLGIKCPPRM